jgi:hypothetical protein
MNDMISAKDYEGLSGFGAGPAMSQGELEDLNKALTAGNSINNPGSSPGEGFPLRVESLERTLKNVTYRMEHLRLFKAISKIPAYNTVEEHNVISSYGQGEEGFVAEDQLPEEDDTTYDRKYAQVKFLGTTRKVTHVMSMIKPAHGNVIANETVSGTMWLLKVLERSLFYANSGLSSLQFDGYEKLIGDNAPAANIIDMRGQPLDEDVLIDAALTISDAPNFGVPTHVHLNPKVKADLVKTFFPKGRYDVGAGTKGNMVGLDIDGFTSPAGDISFEPNVFITDGGGPTAAVGDASKRPGNPTISTAATTPVDAGSLFGADDAGSYFYKITAHNDFGHSDPVAVDAGAIAIAAGDKMTFGVTPAAAGVKWYQLYRTAKGGAVGTTRLIARIPNVSGAGAQTVDDLNATLPGTTSAFMWQQNQEVMNWKQLAPMLKIPLATIGPAIRWMQLIYGVPVLYAPGKTVLVKNIGRAPNFKGQP